MLSLAHEAYPNHSPLSALPTKTVGFYGLEPDLKHSLIELLSQLTMPILWREEIDEQQADVIFLRDTHFNWRTGRSKDEGIDEKRCIILADHMQAAIHPYVIKKPLKARSLINCLNELCVKPELRNTTPNAK